MNEDTPIEEKTNQQIKTEQRQAMMIKALKKTLGVVTPALKAAQVSRHLHYRWLREDEEYKKKVEQCLEAALDFAETNLYKQIEAGQTQATIFLLKTRGKNRGYVEKQEIDHTSSDGTLKPQVIELVGMVEEEAEYIEEEDLPLATSDKKLLN